MVVFLPVRLLFYTYVSPNWIGNLGLLSIIALMVFAVVHTQRGKKTILGKFSLFYRQRMSRLVHNKHSIKFFIVGQCFSAMIYLTLFYASTENIPIDSTPQFNEFNMSIGYSMLPLEDNIDNDMFDTIKNVDINDKEAMNNVGKSLGNTLVGGAFSLETKEQMYVYYKNSRHTDTKFDFPNDEVEAYRQIFEVMSSIPKNTNTYTAGWSSHFAAVWFITDVEFSILFFAYRTVYTKMDMGLPFKAIDAWKSNRGGFLVPDVKELKLYVN